MPTGNIILDIAVVLLLLYGIRSGWRRGLFGVILKSGAGILSTVLAVSFFRRFGEYLSENLLLSPIRERISNGVTSVVGDTPTAEELVASLPRGLANVSGLFGVELDTIAADAVNGGERAVSKFIDGASSAVSGLLGMAIAFFAIFLGSYILIKLFSRPFSRLLMSVPVLGFVNRLLGLAVGLAISCLLSWILVQLVALVADLASLDFFSVETGWVSGMLYRVFPLAKLLG